MEHTVYAAAHCWGAPIPDPRTPTMSVLAVSADGSAIRLVQQVDLPEGSLMPIRQALNAAKTRLFTTAGTHGIVCYELDSEGKIVTTSAPVCSAITPEPLETPYGVMPVDFCLDVSGKAGYTCNFLASSISALAVDMEKGALSEPQLCSPPHAGIPEKVLKIPPSAGAKALGFPEGFPEDASHPHGVACDPSGKWLVMGDLGTNNMSVYSLPVGESFTSGAADFVLEAHKAADANRHGGGGPRQIVFAADGKTLYCVSELDHTVCSYSFDAATGKMAEVGTPQTTLGPDGQAWLDSIPPLPHNYNAQPNYNSGIAISPDGKHVYTTHHRDDGCCCGTDTLDTAQDDHAD